MNKRNRILQIKQTQGKGDGDRVHATQGRDIDGLATDNTGGTDAARIFTWSRVDNSINNHLDGVVARGEVDDVARVFHDPHSKDFLAVVAAVHHKRACNALNDGALSLLEALLVPTPSRVGKEARRVRLACNVIREGHVVDLNLIEGVLVEELDLGRRHLFLCRGFA